MSESPSNQNANELPITVESGIDDLKHTPEESHEVQEDDLRRYRIELESTDEGIRRVNHVHAGSMEQALVKVREADHWPTSGPGSDPSRFRVVEATEESASSEARHQRNARRRYINTIVEAGLTALGKTAPDRSDEESFDVLCDFFTRAIVLPGHFAFPSGDTDADRLLDANDAASVLAQLLTTHLAHHGLKVAQTLPE
ncbi:hypothetical protein [Streptomyces sporangiiformans]|uniref:Uncharacterized protein n=1 Tax=Streptomyces sporangiiformans TaxID=2315329 RepID=A0A505CZD2_9ACTN|nr:hypothetical protein [Streptomyces sporangiiformans]TPQ17463.1 hypothetical protein FGD71_036305 [Streptomyces sporangiiformans]